ncbi:hypothetical protein BKA63DRAFT_554409 [Paraphoma chrysanthemicola]|nr:hypothetical protein BKA63DRAFT_554409 [Paraphoma chrysanthemicola]
MGAVGRSHVQVPLRNTKLFTKSKVRLESKRHTNFNKTHHKLGQRETNTTKNANRAKKATDPPPVVGQEQSDQTADRDDDENFTQDEPSFSKSRVPSTEEHYGFRNFRSELDTAATKTCGDSYESNSATAGRWTDSPPASLMLVSLPMVDAEELLNGEDAGEHILSPSVTDSRNSSTPFLQKLVTLFAGRRRSPDKDNSAYHSTAHSKTSSTTSDSKSSSINPQSPTSEPIRRVPPPNLLPRLTHQDVNPPVQRFDPAYPSYKEILPAPTYRDAGRPCSTIDTFAPASIHRGFDVPNQQTAPVPVHHRRNHSAGNLLDRDGDAWAKWHSKHPCPETNPFSRTHSCGSIALSGAARSSGSRYGDEQRDDQKCTQGHYNMEVRPANPSPEQLAASHIYDEYSFIPGIYW